MGAVVNIIQAASFLMILPGTILGRCPGLKEKLTQPIDSRKAGDLESTSPSVDFYKSMGIVDPFKLALGSCYT